MRETALYIYGNHRPHVRKPPVETTWFVSTGRLRTEMPLIMCFTNGLKRSACFQTVVYAHNRARYTKKRAAGARCVKQWWRRRRDSNPRTRGYRINGFRDRRIQPLCHSSVEVKTARTHGEDAPLKVLAESQGFEPWRRFWRLHDFQSCSFGHSDNSP